VKYGVGNYRAARNDPPFRIVLRSAPDVQACFYGKDNGAFWQACIGVQQTLP